MANITIKINGKDKEYEKGITLLEISKDFKEKYKYDILVGSINNKLMPLKTTVTRNCSVEFYDLTSLLGNNVYQKGLQFLLSYCIKEILSCDVKMLYSLDNCIYCEILSNNVISDVTVEKIKNKMKYYSENGVEIEKIIVSRVDAMEYYKQTNQMDKANSLRYISDSSISLYKINNSLDYYYYVLPNNTNQLKYFNIKNLGNNKIVLMYPDFFDIEKELKYVKNDKLMDTYNENSNFLNSLNITTSANLNKAISNGKYSDFIRISEIIQNNEILNIVNTISKNKDIKIVLMTGPSSSGKTTISKKFSLLLKSKGINPIQISLDDFFINVKDRELDENGEPEKEKISVINVELFNEKITDLINRKEVRMPKFNFKLGRQELSSEITKMSDNSILVIEGIHSFSEKLLKNISNKYKYKIFLCPLTPLNIDNHNMFKSTDNRLIRRIIRDNIFRNTSASDTLRYWKNVRKAEEKNIFPYMKDADIILNTSLLYELPVLKTYAEALLFSVKEDDENYEEAIRLINLFRVIVSMPSDNVPQDSILREFIGGSCFKD